MRKRNKSILIRLTDDEYYDLIKRAQECGYSREHYIRTIIFNCMIPQPLLPKKFHETIRHLRAIGNNINQIAMVANITGVIDVEKYKQERWNLGKEILEIRRIAGAPLKINNENMEDK